MKIFFLVLVTLFPFLGMAQEPVQLGKNSSDCVGALLINDTVVGPVFSAPGFGTKLEIQGFELGDPIYIQREHNTVWYKFIAPYDAILTFDVVPIQQDDDFDFLLFKYSGPNFCQEIADGTTVPLRSNISRKNIEVRGMTGLREGEVYDYVPSGPGSSYSRPLGVKKGETYYLLIDNPFRENKGHSIYLHYRKLRPSEPMPAENEEPEVKYEIPMTLLQVDVKNAETGDPVGANISIEGVMIGNTVDYKMQSRILLEVMSYKTYTINCNLKGFLLASKSIVPKTDSVYHVEILLKPMREGDRVTMENIKFEGDRTEILRKSEPSLKQLYDFLLENPHVQVEIQGHVNGPGKKNKKEYRKLSEERAAAVFNYLKEKGVNVDRLTYAGYGNQEMIYPEPVNKHQEEANRRVEIKILSL